VQKSPAAADIDAVIRYKKETKWMNKKKEPHKSHAAADIHAVIRYNNDSKKTKTKKGAPAAAGTCTVT